LKLAKEYAATIPFIVLTGSINEETAVECMKIGAMDYVIKDRIIRLPFAVQEGLERMEDKKEKKAAEQALQESKEFAGNLIASMQDGISVLDSNGVHIDVNAAFCKMTGFSREELIGVGMPHPYWPQKAHEEIERKFQQTLRGDFGDVELTFMRKNGERFPVIVSPSWVQDNQGNVVSYFATVKDITERKRAEEALRNSEERYRKQFEEAIDAIFLADIGTGMLVDCNIAASKLVEREKSEIIGNHQSFLHPARYTKDRFSETFKSHITGNASELLEDRVITKSGQIKDVAIRASKITIEGKEVMQGIFRDITERKKAEEALALSGLRTKELLDMHLMGDASQEQFMDFALGASFRMTQSEVAFIGLMDEAEAVMTIHRWSKEAMNQCAMDNKPLLYPIAETGWWGDCVRTRNPVLVNDYSAPHPTKKGIPEGHVPICRFLAVPIFDGTRIVAVAAVANKHGDYTDSDIYAITSLMNKLWEILMRKRSEQALKKLHHHNELILNSAQEGIIGLDSQGNQTFVNPSAASMLGYETEELIGGKSHTIWHHTKADGSTYPEDECPIYATLKDGTVHPNLREEVFWRKAGTSFPVAYSSNPIMDKGKIIGAVVNFRDITVRKQMEEKLQYLAYYDPLTDLPNRNLFLEKIDQEIAVAKDISSSIAVVITDINKFKSIYDIYGSEVGDRVLKEIAERLSTATRKGDTVAHLGNDEFGIICISSTGFDSIIMLEKIIKDISYPLKIDGDEIILTFSTGISLYPHDGENASKLHKSAGLALSAAKKEGRKTYQFYSEDMIVTAREMMLLEKQLVTAIKNEEFILHYQPYWDITTKKMVGMEALIRWQSKEKGLVPPGKFIPILEDTGMIIEVGEWILREAMRQVKEWQNNGHPVAPVSVNMSLVQFRQKDLAEMVKRIMGECGFYPSLLTLEITESAFMQDIEFTRSVLTAMKEIGCSVSIDDFGTGYSSLAYLKRFPIDNLKIDISFIREMVKDPDSASIVMAIINMAHTLSLKTIAEGIETEEQWNFLRLLRCDMGQGFYLSKPLPVQEFEKLFNTVTPDK